MVLVGPSGKVLGIEREARSVARARSRVAEAGLRNVSFRQCDVDQITSDQPFDAAVGRMISAKATQEKGTAWIVVHF